MVPTYNPDQVFNKILLFTTVRYKNFYHGFSIT